MIDSTRTDRRIVDAAVDFTMMYAAHDAFARHLELLASAIEQGTIAAPGVSARWALFKKQLHIHHTVEDDSLWPRVRLVVSERDDLAVLDTMADEHAQLDLQLDRVDAALGGAGDPVASIRALSAALAAHLRHEEDGALPLVARYLGPAGWAAFVRDIRRVQGLRGGAGYFPWLLDGASGPEATKLLAVLPPPLRFVCRRVWVPRYRRALVS